MKTFKGIDISKYQGNVDFERVKNSGIQFIIMRCGTGYGGPGMDSKFTQYSSECERLGIPYGVYYISYAKTVEEAQAEAKNCIEIVKGHKLAYGVWYDLETYHSSVASLLAITFCDMLEDAGYYCGIYASRSYFQSYLNDSSLDVYARWVAEWGDSCNYNKDYYIWQYTSSGSVDGISGRVDMDTAFLDFENIMRVNGLCGYTKQSASNGADVTLSVGDTVEIIDTGSASAYSEVSRAYGIGWKREILKIHPNALYPYQVGDSTGTTGFYKASALRRV